MSQETTDNIAESVCHSFEILSVVSEIPVEDLYGNVDAHMTDFTSHNMGIAEACASKMDHENPAGQVFCVTRTTLAYEKDMKTVICKIESDMGMENIIGGFLRSWWIDIAGDKHDIGSLSFISWALNPFGPDLIQKPWNYHKDFMTFLHQNGRTPHLFHLKDAMFGALSQCCAIVCYHWSYIIENVLASHDYVTKHGAKFPVFEQTTDCNFDNTPVNNIYEERSCGEIDQRLKKKSSLEAASRGMILKAPVRLSSVSNQRSSLGIWDLL